MVKFLVMICVFLGAVYTYESFSENDYGVRRTVDRALSVGFAGGYIAVTTVGSAVGSTAAGITSSAVGAFGGLANN